VHISYTAAGDIPTLRQPDIHQAIEDCLREIADRHRKAQRARDAGPDQKHADFRVVHYSIQRSHLHLIVEALNRQALSRGLKGLAVRVAKRINKLVGREGPLFVDRYFERVLKSPKQARSCLLYVLNNARRHAVQAGLVCEPGWVDPCSSGRFFDGWRLPIASSRRRSLRARAGPVKAAAEHAPTVSRPHTWLLAKGWRRHGLLPVDEVPGDGAHSV
jgi:REP element-mobilizing transposase RayT